MKKTTKFLAAILVGLLPFCSSQADISKEDGMNFEVRTSPDLVKEGALLRVISCGAFFLGTGRTFDVKKLDGQVIHFVAEYINWPPPYDGSINCHVRVENKQGKKLYEQTKTNIKLLKSDYIHRKVVANNYLITLYKDHFTVVRKPTN